VKKLCIIGVGGTAKDLIDLLGLLSRTAVPENQWDCIGILDDDEALQGGKYAGIPVIGKLADAASLGDDVSFAFAIGSPRTVGKRKTIFDGLGIKRERFPSFIHPKAIIEETASIGNGVIVFPGVVVSGSARVGDFNIILPNSVINHDSTLGDFTCLASGVCISGHVAVGNDSYIGANAALRDGIRVGAGSLVGLGSAVVSDIPSGCTAYGVPARVIPSVPISSP